MKDKKPLLEALETSPVILSELLRSIPDQLLTARRGGGFWSIEEHAIHLAQVQPMLLDRLNRFIKEKQPEFTPFIPENEISDKEVNPNSTNEIDLDTALHAFGSLRRKQLDLLNTIAPHIWEKKAIHPEYTQYSFYILVRHILMHDHWHMYRIEELWLTRDEYLTRLQG